MNAGKTKKRKPMSRDKRKVFQFFGYISPWLIGLVCFTVVPMVLSLIFSFTSVSMATVTSSPWVFVGLDNYAYIITQDGDFTRAILNTLIYSFSKVFFLTLLAILFALLLNKKILGRSVFRVMIYLPAVIPVVSVALLWKLIFTGGEFNVINYFLSYLGLAPVNFFGNEVSSMATVVFVGVWSGLGPNMLIMLAAIQGVSQDEIDACRIDGANAWQRFAHIILPAIYPVIFFTILTGLIGSLQSYAEIELLTGGGPGNATITMSMIIVSNAFKTTGKKTLGYASAQGWIVFLLSFILMFIYVTYSNRRSKKTGEVI